MERACMALTSIQGILGNAVREILAVVNQGACFCEEAFITLAGFIGCDGSGLGGVADVACLTMRGTGMMRRGCAPEDWC